MSNKRWRKDGKDIDPEEPTLVNLGKQTRLKKRIKVRITSRYYGGLKITSVSKYRTMRDAENAMKRAGVIRARIIENKTQP